MVSEPNIFPPTWIEAKFTIKMKKLDYDQRIFHQFLQQFKEEEVPMEER